jgi:mannitol/fructose-specific phosphotransferase system IIA component (Ntr-type)
MRRTSYTYYTESLLPVRKWDFIWGGLNMVLTQLLQPTCVKVPLEGTDKDGVITELVDLLDANGLLLDRENVLEAVFNRERIRGTGIGIGIAIPHGKCTGVNELVMAIGIAHEPIDFESIDGKPVFVVVLLLSPPDQTGPHIQALARIGRMLLDKDFKKALEEAESDEAVYELLSTREHQPTSAFSYSSGSPKGLG